MSRFLLATFLISVLVCESGRSIAGADINAADRTESRPHNRRLPRRLRLPWKSWLIR